MNKKNKKKVVATTAALALLVTGTFAWQSFSQLATNEIIESVDAPGGRLHDYFNGEDKDVFVENYASGDNAPDVYARIRIAEYLEHGKGAGSLDASSDSMTIVRGDIQDPGTTPSISEADTWDVYDYAAATDSDIRAYRELELGGSSVYMPTFNQDNTDKNPDVRGTFRDADGDVKETPYDDYPNPAFVAGTTTETGTVETADDSYSDTHTAKATQTAGVTSMAEWLADGAPVGDTWVFDTDGWAYYAAPIAPETASGLLVDEITTVSNPKEEWYYAVDITAQLATAGDWGKADDADTESSMYASTMSANGLYVLNKAAGIATVENMTITNNGTALSTTDAILSTTPITFDVNMDVVNGSTDTNAKAAELALTWSIAEEGVEATAISLGGTLVQSGNKAVFTATQAMIDSGSKYVITATSVMDPSKSVSITMHDGKTTGLPEEPKEEADPGDSKVVTLPTEISDSIKGIEAGSTSTVTIDDQEFYVLDKVIVTEVDDNGDKVGTHEAALLWVLGEATSITQFNSSNVSLWETSTMRLSTLPIWLSGKSNLSAAAIQVEVVTDGYYTVDSVTADGSVNEITYDKAFLLSQKEFITTYSLANTTQAKASTGNNYYWLRSANSESSMQIVSPAFASVFWFGNNASDSQGVRPALWVAL